MYKKRSIRNNGEIVLLAPAISNPKYATELVSQMLTYLVRMLSSWSKDMWYVICGWSLLGIKLEWYWKIKKVSSANWIGSLNIECFHLKKVFLFKEFFGLTRHLLLSVEKRNRNTYSTFKFRRNQIGWWDAEDISFM